MNRAGAVVAILAALSVTPGISEVAENVFHLVEHGDLAHLVSSSEHSEDSEDSEHGCSGPYHFCVCHTSSLFLVADGVLTTDVVDPDPREPVPMYFQRMTQAHPQSIFRPPIV